MPRGRKNQVEENIEMADETATPDLNVTVGVDAPTRMRTGAGRARKENPFDDLMKDLYESGQWASVPFEDEEEKDLRRNQIKNSAQHHGYGLDLSVDAKNPNLLKFLVRDKVEGRGRKPGTKKVDGEFWNPEELDENGMPTDEARKAHASSTVTENPSE